MNVFHVLTEFRFDVAHAVAGSQTLQSEVGKISDAANNAMYNIQRMGFGLVAQMGLGSGGVLGFLYAAVQASDKFAQSQRNLSNILLSNNRVFKNGGFTFQGAMDQSAGVMNTVIGKARDFALDPNDLLNAVKAVAPVLVSHGLEKTSQLPISIDIARGFLKSAPTLGVDPSLAMNQLTNMTMGRASLQDTLFQRLMSETAPFREGKINSSQAFNALPAQKRIEMLRQSLLQFGSNADVLRGNMMSLNGQMTVFASLIKGQFSVFKRVGDVLIEPIKMILSQVNGYLMTKGKAVADNLAKLIEPFVKDPQALLTTIMQLGRLKHDLNLSAHLLYLMGVVGAIRTVLGFFGIQIGGFLTLGRVMGWVGSALGFLASNFGTIATWSLRLGKFLVTGVLWPITLFTTVLQGISKGIASAKLEDAKWIADHLDRITDLMNKFAIVGRKLMLPITMAIDGIASIVAWFLTFGSTSEWALEKADSVLGFFNLLGNAVVGLGAVIAAVTNVIMGEIFRFKAIFTGGDLKGIGTPFQNAKEGFEEFWKMYSNPLSSASKEQAVSAANITIGSVEINNAFKEQAQPDRIAFTMKEQLIKAALNPMQGTRTMRGALLSR